MLNLICHKFERKQKEAKIVKYLRLYLFCCDELFFTILWSFPSFLKIWFERFMFQSGSKGFDSIHSFIFLLSNFNHLQQNGWDLLQLKEMMVGYMVETFLKKHQKTPSWVIFSSFLRAFSFSGWYISDVKSNSGNEANNAYTLLIELCIR